MSAPPVLPPTCPHGLRPGTTICLHCRYDARNALRRRRYKLAARVGVLAIGGGVLVTLLVGGLTAIAPDARSFGRSISAPATPARATRPAPPAARVAPERLVVVEPTMAIGRKHLGDSVYAERVGNEVTLSFDTDALRTRFDWKFEGVVRSTLPLLFGEDVRVALDSIPSGRFVREGDLMKDMVRRGIPLRLSGGRTLMVWPVLRQGRDGPIVVGYRAAGSK